MHVSRGLGRLVGWLSGDWIMAKLSWLLYVTFCAVFLLLAPTHSAMARRITLGPNFAACTPDPTCNGGATNTEQDGFILSPMRDATYPVWPMSAAQYEARC